MSLIHYVIRTFISFILFWMKIHWLIHTWLNDRNIEIKMNQEWQQPTKSRLDFCTLDVSSFECVHDIHEFKLILSKVVIHRWRMIIKYTCGRILICKAKYWFKPANNIHISTNIFLPNNIHISINQLKYTNCSIYL